jgi:RecB family exonuclease
MQEMIFSASRITLWLQCKRAWAFKYILKVEPPPSRWQDLGSKVHKILEDHVRDGTQIDRTDPAGNLAGRIAPYVTRWVQNPGARPEVSFKLLGTFATWQGFKDLEVPSEIIDYKTSGNLSYAMTSAQLQGDPQAILYSEDYFRRFGEKTVKLSWLYVEKKSPYKFLPVHATMTREHAAAAFGALDSFAAEAKTLDVKTEVDILKIEGNYLHCSAYGGCPYRNRCGRNFPFSDKD